MTPDAALPAIRIAVVGTGGIAQAHAEALASVPGVEIVAAVDVDKGRAAEFATRWGIPAVFDDLATALDGAQIDVVHICTPPGTHLDLALAALEAGRSVLIEKPPTLTLAEQSQLVDAAEASAGHAAVVFQHRFGSGAIALRSMVEAGVLGRPTVATCDTLWFRDDDYYALPWRGTWDAEGGGPTMGHGIHQFDLMLSILGPWSRVSAFVARRARPVETEDVATAILEFESGPIASLVNSVLSPRETSSVRFDFEFATVELIHLYGYDDSDWTITPAPGHEELAATWADLLGGTPSGHLAQFTEFYLALREGRVPPVSARDALVTMQLAAGIYQSAFEGRVVARNELDASDPYWGAMNGGRSPFPMSTAPV